MTVQELATLLEGLDPETPVLVHIGWDLEITDTDIDDNGLILFADDSEVITVCRQWFDAYTDLSLGGGA